jgi:hypothetical protein
LLVNNTSGSGTGSGAVLVTGAGSVLGGTGAMAGALNVQSEGTLAPGIPSGGTLSPVIGTLTAGDTTINGNVLMKINRSSLPISDKLTAPSVSVIAGSTLTLTNLGQTNFVAGDIFALFSVPISGAFSLINLPALADTNLVWTNKLGVDGTMAVVALVTINPDSTNITANVSGDMISLSWPLDHTGWTLQVQTNSVSVGLGTNWMDVPGSTATNSVTVPVSIQEDAVFYRLKL